MTLLHIEIPDEILNRIDLAVEGKNTTDKVRNYLFSEYISRDFLLAEKERCELKVSQITRLLQKNPFHDKDTLSPQEKEFLELSIDTVNRNPDYLYGQKDLYNKKFNKKLTSKEFKLLLYELKEELEKKK